MEKDYTINEVAMMTGLTPRTLRNYIKANYLCGKKDDGIWRFSLKEVTDFVLNQNVRPSIQAKSKAIVYDFLIDSHKSQNEICTIINLYEPNGKTNEISEFFCKKINTTQDSGELKFSFEKVGYNVRVILKGTEKQVINILNCYYNR